MHGAIFPLPHTPLYREQLSVFCICMYVRHLFGDSQIILLLAQLNVCFNRPNVSISFECVVL